MGRINYHSFRLGRAKQLDDLASILEVNGACKDVSPIRSAASQFRKRAKKDRFWGYDISGLLFDVDAVRHVIPQDVYDVRLLLDVSVQGECADTDSLNDLLTHLQIDIEITGRRDSNINLLCTWHLDKHTFRQGVADPDDAHPYYHFHFGGKGMRQLSNLGESLILEPPRLAHPPLDGILAIDFVLSNYCGLKWKGLRTDGLYVSIIKDAQYAFWRPYARVIATAWEPVSEKMNWYPKNIWPQLVSP